MAESWLLIRHSRNAKTDRIENWLVNRKIHFDITVPRQGDTLPEPGKHQRYVIYGGVPNVTTSLDKPWMTHELDYMERCLALGVPGLGICLGAQMMAYVLGAQIGKLYNGQREVGYEWIYPTQHGAPFLTSAIRILQWHSQGFSLPENSLHLASSRLFEHQAFYHQSKSIGLQFHPEVNLPLLIEWQQRNATQKSDWLTPAVKWHHRMDAIRLNRSIHQWTHDFLQEWIRDSTPEQL